MVAEKNDAQNKELEILFQRRMNKDNSVEDTERLLKKEYRNFDIYFELIRPMIKKQSVIVDAMCGPAFFSFLLYKKGYKNITGFDISPHTIETTKKLFNKHAFNKAEFFAGDVNDIKLKDGFADFVLVLTSLHHLVLMGKAARELKRILKPGGHLVAIEPNALNPVSNYQHTAERRRGRTSVNEKLPTPFSLKKAFYEAGFSSVRMFTFRFLPNLNNRLFLLEKALEKTPIVNLFGSKIVIICRK